MSYLANETSQEGGRPVELYLFTQGGNLYPYTSAEDSQFVGILEYLPEVISRGRLSEGPEERTNLLQVTVPTTNVFAAQYIGSVPGPRATLSIQRFHRGDGPTPELVTIFQGGVQSVSYTEDGISARIAVLPITAAASRRCPRFTYQGLCNNFLYDPFCKVDPENLAFKHVGIVSSVVGNVINVNGADGFPDGWFTAGFVEAASGLDARMVIDHVGTTLTLHLPFSEAILCLNVTVRAGCDHTIETCDQKFFTAEDPDSNVINFSGFKFVPTKNIFETGLK